MDFCHLSAYNKREQFASAAVVPRDRRPTPICAEPYADTLRMEVEARCPCCGEPICLVIDEGGGRRQQYVEDCWVCCRPIAVRVLIEAGEARVDLGRADD